MTKLALALVLAVALSLGVAAASATPDENVRVIHGAGIGRIKLGMTYAEVRKILGGPQTVDRREKLRDGRRYLELSWDFGWWTVGFYGKPGHMRVASVQTINRRQRTAEHLGVGSLERTVRRTLRVRCTTVAERIKPDWPFEFRCAYPSHRGRETVFTINFTNGIAYRWRGKAYEVSAVRVQETRADWCSRGAYVCNPLPPM
jgi:hypothetical protein